MCNANLTLRTYITNSLVHPCRREDWPHPKLDLNPGSTTRPCRRQDGCRVRSSKRCPSPMVAPILHLLQRPRPHPAADLQTECLRSASRTATPGQTRTGERAPSGLLTATSGGELCNSQMCQALQAVSRCFSDQSFIHFKVLHITASRYNISLLPMAVWP